MKSLAWDQTRLDGLLAGQTEALAASLTAAGHSRETLAVVHTAGIRYSGQSYETPIAAAALHDPQVLGQQFDEAHRALYGYATGEPWELVSVRTEVSAPERPGEPHVIVGTDAPPTAAAPPRIVTFEDGTSASVSVLDRDTLPVHVRMPGPLVIEDEWSTVIVPPRDTAWMDGRGNLHIAVSLAR
jgi:N-methylhydantoinase A